MKVHLNDCSDLWSDLVYYASESVVVFTPYFDEVLEELFDECHLDYSEITLVTQLDRQDSRPENLKRLSLILSLHNKGVNVRILNRLHAKILLVDDEKALFGSQNFTRFSTGSFEITSEYTYEDDEFWEFIEKLQDWLRLARPLSFAELTEASDYQVIFQAVEDDKD
jgi:hypothetical protein